MRTACYLRFSSENQKETSIDDQLRVIQEYCTRENLPMPIVFEDRAISGSRNDREGYLAMLEAAKNKQFEMLLVYNLARLSRDQLESMKVVRILTHLSIRIIGLSDGIDTSRSSFKLETAMHGIINEMYLDTLAKDVHRAMNGRALEGYSPGHYPYGYASIKDGRGFKRIINEDRAQWVRYAFTRYAEGISPRMIAVELNQKGVKSVTGGKWMASTLQPIKGSGPGILANPMYLGKIIWNQRKNVKDPITNRRKQVWRPKEEWLVIEAPELRIIDDETWKKCQTRIKANHENTVKQRESLKANGGGRISKYIFNGILKCGVCGGRITMKNSKIYGCVNTCDTFENKCTNRVNIARTKLEEVLMAHIRTNLLTEDAYQEFVKETEILMVSDRPDATPIKKRIAVAEKELENLMKAIKAGIITVTTKSEVENAERQIAEAQRELKALEQYEPAKALPKARQLYETLVATFECAENVYLVREAIRKLVGTILLHPQPDKTLVAELEHGSLTIALSEMNPSGPYSMRSRHPKVIPLY